ncbi:MAG: flavin-dependent dehydrogenase [Bradymonadia bacterium]|jgi:flavin-dependent dehydrogenase
MMLEALENRIWDVIIAGGGLAGLTLARQLKMEFEEMEILVVEKVARPLPDGCHKVGESSVELGSNYLETLGLQDYLRENHIIKHGLRFFPGGGKLPLEDRCEIGPAQEPIVPSYQVDRGRLETDLREMVIEQGITLVEGATVREPELGTDGANHTAIVRTGHGDARVEARWLLDATGRTALLRKKMKLSRGTRHPASSGWFRIAGKFDINDMVPAENKRWHDVEFKKDRWRSTNHFMGEGYWVWVIPLATGMTSIGVVVHDDTHSFDDVRTLDRIWAWLEEHEPVLANAISDRERLDFLCIKGYSHNVTRPWSADRWGMVGEAGAFVDPLYSPGTDFIAFANCFTTELIRTEREGGDLQQRVRELSLQYRALVLGNIDVYRVSSPVYGHPSAMLMKIFWDNYAYWCFPCQYYFQKVYKLTGPAHSAFNTAGQRFVELSNYMQSLYREWALAKPETPRGQFVGMPAFPSVLVDAHLALEKSLTPEQTLEYVSDRAEVGAQIASEMLVRVLWALGDDAARKVAAETGFAKWDMKVDPHRIDIGRTIGLARRRALTPIARDIERTLGRPVLETSDEVMRELLAPLFLQSSAEALPAQ